MEIHREIIHKLQQWKERKDRKPLILQGARQIGKTTAIRMFAQESYAHLAEFNFDKNKELKTLFERTKDIKRILQELFIIWCLMDGTYYLALFGLFIFILQVYNYFIIKRRT